MHCWERTVAPRPSGILSHESLTELHLKQHVLHHSQPTVQKIVGLQQLRQQQRTMFGWSQATYASCDPSGLIEGLLKKS